MPEQDYHLPQAAILTGQTRDPVRSPIDKPVRAKLVAGSVTTSESLVLLVFFFFLSFVLH